MVIVSTHDAAADIICRSAALQYVFNRAREAGPADEDTVVLGPTGTGKRVVAEIIHASGPRRARPLVFCSASELHEDTGAAALFGHTKDAYTGAERDAEGILVSASGNDLVMEDVDKLPRSLQEKLLRFMDDRMVQVVGGRLIGPVNVRLIFTSNRDVLELARRGEFSMDFAHRIWNGVKIIIPPLRERPEDIEALVDHYRREFARAYRKPTPEVSPEAMGMLVSQEWPGNVRQVQGVMRNLVFDARGRIEVGDVEAALTGLGASASLHEEIKRIVARPLDEHVSREALVKVLVCCGWDVSAVAKLWGCSRPTVYRRMGAHGVRRRLIGAPHAFTHCNIARYTV